MRFGTLWGCWEFLGELCNVFMWCRALLLESTGPSLGENESTNFPGSTFEIFRLSILEIVSFCKMFLKNMLARYRGINNKGVLERPWTKWMVLKAISTTLKCQFTGKC